MKKIFLVIWLSFFSSVLFAKETIDLCTRVSHLIKTINKHHYRPRAIDDQFSKFAFDQLLELVDNDKTIFSKADFLLFLTHENKIDDDIKNYDCSFVVQLYEKYLLSLQHKIDLLHSYQTEPLNFDEKDSIIFNLDATYLTRSNLKKRWVKELKYDVLYAALSLEHKPSKEDFFILQQKIVKKMLCDLQQTYSQEDFNEFYLKAIAFAFDPHTTYFSPKEESNFEARLSKESYSFGLSIFLNDVGDYEIDQLVPGGSAWKSNRINEGDILLSIKAKGKQVVTSGCRAFEDISAFFESTSNKSVTFHLRKKNGDEINVALSRTKTEVQDNIIQSFVLKRPQRKVGYICLPSFYVADDFSDVAPNGCANDVAKELIKLKRENIDGLILDLRNNGGGSMMEAIRMVGIFIDYGSVSILDSKHYGAELLKDMSRGILFDKPLVVLVNKFSASASELFSAAIQDYNRGLIVGGKTYGKSTAQSVLPLDAFKSQELNTSVASKDGYVKLTHSVFYRVTGKSHQNTGVLPDIILPSKYDFIDLGESEFMSSLKSTSIDKKSYYKPLVELPKYDLLNSSKARLSKDKFVTNFVLEAKAIATDYYLEVIPLDYQNFYNYYHIKSDEILFEPKFEISNTSYLKGMSDINDTSVEVNQWNMTQIKYDFQINESFNILNDLINQ